jgi:hypothetical protein
MGRWAVRRLGELLGLTEAAGGGSDLEDSLSKPPVILPVELRARASTAAPRTSI